MKAKKTKSTKSKSVSVGGLKLTKLDSHRDARSVVALFILLLAFGIFLIFSSYKDQIINGGNFQLFMVLSVACMGFLIGLLFLANKPHKR